jgi:hypothetical protein
MAGDGEGGEEEREGAYRTGKGGAAAAAVRAGERERE